MRWQEWIIKLLCDVTQIKFFFKINIYVFFIQKERNVSENKFLELKKKNIFLEICETRINIINHDFNCFVFVVV